MKLSAVLCTSIVAALVAAACMGTPANAASCTTAAAAPANLIASNITTSSVTLSWKAVTAPSNCTITDYVVSGVLGAAATTGTTYTIYSLAPSSTYTFKVYALDGDASAGAASSVTFTTPAAVCSALPAAPTGVTASGVTSTSATISWNPVAAPSGCTIKQYVVGYSLGEVAVTGTSYTFTGLVQNGDYEFTVYAVDGYGSGAGPSGSVIVKTPASSPCTGIPAWSGNSVAYTTGEFVTYNGSEYKCIQGHTSESNWDPPAVPALWSLVGGC